MEEYEIEITSIEDWNEKIRQHKETLEKETKEREDKIRKKESKEQSWHLYNHCKNFLEENEQHWEARRNERNVEMRKKERLHEAKLKQEIIKENVKERNLDRKLEEKKKELPKSAREKIENEEKRKRRLDLKVH